ncbi:arginase [candidate division KSB1 bacterium]|nr:MAG: arginase [candidate division KSB1 bacterium]MBC6946381.1 arginase [candidate division KSB1 bacterium]MCE7943760.1 arginase [Chlorobi bacterium CHB1]MDL1878123.1 arginase [Cytophagia bacterium CHB2]
MHNQFILSPFFLEKPLPVAERLASPEWIINKPQLPEGGQMACMSIVHRHLADIVANTVKSGHRPVSVVGDCCATIGVLAGLQHAGLMPRLVWLDAHGDFNTWETTPSGFIGGMPLAMIVGRGDQTLLQAASLAPLAERDVILVDARDLDPGERELLQQSAVLHVTKVAALPQLVSATQPLYIHLDVDVLDFADAPAMKYPVRGGPELGTLCAILEHLANSAPVVGVSMTLWDLEQDADGRTAHASMALLQAAIGEAEHDNNIGSGKPG